MPVKWRKADNMVTTDIKVTFSIQKSPVNCTCVMLLLDKLLAVLLNKNSLLEGYP